MNRCSSFSLLDDFVRDRGIDILSYADLKNSLAKYVNEDNSPEEAVNAFFIVYLSVINCKESIQWIWGRISDAIDRFGFVFARSNYTYEDSLSTSDHLLLLTSRMMLKSFTVQGVKVLCQLVDDHIMDHVDTSVLSLCTNSFLSNMQTTKLDKVIVRQLSAWITKISQLPQWDSGILEVFLSQWDKESLSETYWFALNCLAPSFESQFVSFLFLPVIETKQVKQVIKQLGSDCPLLCYDLSLVIQRLFHPLNKEHFALWIDCVHSLANTTIPDIDYGSIITMMVRFALNERNSLLYRQKCLNSLSTLLSTHPNESFEMNEMTALLVSILRSSNDRLIQKGLELIGILHVSKEQEGILRQSLLLLYEFLLQRDFEAGSDASVTRMKCFHLLKSFRLGVSELVQCVLLPLQSFSFLFSKQIDLVELIQETVKRGFKQENPFRMAEDRWNEVVCLTLQIGLSVPDKDQLRKDLSVQFGLQLSENQLFVSLSLCQCISFQPPISVLDQILSFPSSLATEILLNLFCQLWNHSTTIDKRFLIPLLQHASHSSLSTSLSPSLRLISSLPFSFLQEFLVSLSADIVSDEQILTLLRLLRVINAKSYAISKASAKQIIQDNDVDEEIREQTTQASQEASLNVTIDIKMRNSSPIFVQGFYRVMFPCSRSIH